MTPEHIAHYRIVKKIGAGGMGEIYLAEDTRLHRHVALKLLPVNFANDPALKERFIREARAVSSLSHPHICVVFDFGEAPDGRLFTAMEYIEGETLASKIGGRPLGVTEIATLGIQIADALDEAHAKGVTHRDIKPANIMITPRGQVKVLDFGLAKIASDSGRDLTTHAATQTGIVMGTVDYMSPEQALGRKADHRTDIFSLGVVLYEMATGRLPFGGHSATETIDKIVHAQPEAMARFNYDVLPDLDRIVRKCLEKDRESRYQSVREVFVDLKNLKRDSTVVSAARPATHRRRPWIWAAPAGLLVMASVLIGLYVQGASTPAPEAPAPADLAAARAEAQVSYRRAVASHTQYRASRDGADFDKASNAYQQALKLDPQLGDAAAGIAMLWQLKAEFGAAPPEEAMREMARWAKDATERDPRSSRAWAISAGVEYQLPSNKSKGLEYALKAVTLDPREPAGYNTLGHTLRESIVLSELVFRRGSEAQSEPWDAGLTPFYLGRPKEALANMERAVRVYPDNSSSLWMYAILLTDAGRVDEAKGVLKRLESKRVAADLLDMARHALALETRDAASAAAALRGIQQFVKDPGRFQHDLGYVTLVTVPLLARHNDVNAALPLLRQLEDQSVIPYDWLRDHPYLDSLRREPQFQSILNRSRTRFQDLVAVMRRSQAIGELPEFLVKPLDELVTRLGIKATAN